MVLATPPRSEAARASSSEIDLIELGLTDAKTLLLAVEPGFCQRRHDLRET